MPKSLNPADVIKVMQHVRAGKKQREIADALGKSSVASIARCMVFARRKVATALNDPAWLDHNLRTHVQVAIEYLMLEAGPSPLSE